MEFPRDTQKHCQSHYAIQNYTQPGCHQSRLLYLFSDITHTTQSKCSIQTLQHIHWLLQIQLLPCTVVLWNVLPPDVVSASSLDQFKSQIQTHYLYFFFTVFHFICKYVTLFLLIHCKYMVCSRRCIVVTIDGASYDVDVDVNGSR